MLNTILIAIVFIQIIIIAVLLITERGDKMRFLKKKEIEENTIVEKEEPALKSKTIQAGKEVKANEEMNIDAAKQRKTADLEYFKDIYLGSYSQEEFAGEGTFEAEICTLMYGLLQEMKNQNYMLQQIMLSLQK